MACQWEAEDRSAQITVLSNRTVAFPGLGRATTLSAIPRSRRTESEVPVKAVGFLDEHAAPILRTPEEIEHLTERLSARLFCRLDIHEFTDNLES